MKSPLKLLLILFVAGAVLSGSLLAFRLAGNHKEQQAVVQLQREKAQAIEKVDTTNPQDSQDILPAYRKLSEENPDMVGWLTIGDTAIDYPVMQRDEEYYLTRDFEGNPSSIGLPFVDIRCDLSQPSQGQNLLIHGHNMRDGKMFNDLEKYLNPDFADQYPVIHLDTLTEERTYRVIGVLLLPLENGFNPYNFLQTDQAEQVAEVNQILQDYSLWGLKQEIEVGDSLLTLSTCSYQVEDGRLLVWAVQES